MKLKTYCTLIIFILFNCHSILTIRLRGVTLEVIPYVYVRNNEFHGYCVDVMNEISKIAGFNYSLYVVPDGHHGSVSPVGAINGIIGEIFNKAADFGLADLTTSDNRKRYVDFSRPIMNLSVSALIHTTNAERVDRFRDLSKQTRIMYGTVRSGRLRDKFADARDSYFKKMYDVMKVHNTFVANASAGIRLAKIDTFAYISESANNEFIAANDCDLVSIKSYSDYFKLNYAIALPKGSPYLSKINYAIQVLETEGLFNKLKAKYWRTQCNLSTGSYYLSVQTNVLLFIMILLSLIYSKH
ncbi:glutamate receptor ionotropic, kainate 1-like [Oppia nitens]|uniref:glutamate receptor ionotropic, kainate 1-like n=1 Tax=Oppia nitens TaxID=1686743 RepID=UPI0023DCCA99|nr:glutamate receptor ionotropic, kainate 1-like [Oppia nitens]